MAFFCIKLGLAYEFKRLKICVLIEGISYLKYDFTFQSYTESEKWYDFLHR